MLCMFFSCWGAVLGMGGSGDCHLFFQGGFCWYQGVTWASSYFGAKERRSGRRPSVYPDTSHEIQASPYRSHTITPQNIPRTYERHINEVLQGYTISKTTLRRPREVAPSPQ